MRFRPGKLRYRTVWPTQRWAPSYVLAGQRSRTGILPTTSTQRRTHGSAPTHRRDLPLCRLAELSDISVKACRALTCSTLGMAQMCRVLNMKLTLDENGIPNEAPIFDSLDIDEVRLGVWVTRAFCYGRSACVTGGGLN